MKFNTFKQPRFLNQGAAVRAAPIAFEENWEDALRSGRGTTMMTPTSAMKLSAVNRAVECLSNSISKLPLYALDLASKNRPSHGVLELMNLRANEAMTASVYKKLMECNRLLSGNAYALIVRHPSTAAPVELIPLPPRYVQVKVSDSGRVFYLFSNPKTGEQRRLDNFDVLHYKAYSEDGLRGVSVLSRASDVLATAASAQTYEEALFLRNSRPTGVLTIDTDLNKESKEKVREEWEKIHHGADNGFRVAVLDLGLKYQQVGLSNKDTQFVENKELSILDIARFFDVPAYKLSAGKQTYNSNEQNGIEYVTNTLHPIVEQLEQEDTYKLLFPSERRRIELKRNVMAELRGDFATRGAWYETMRNCGAFSVDDILALEDLPAVAGGHTRNASLNYIPLELFESLSTARNNGGGTI